MDGSSSFSATITNLNMDLNQQCVSVFEITTKKIMALSNISEATQ